ncbi:MAG: hypothetical protein LBF85_11140 [Tannerella sp.]|nr:hypothetical protein [Tannerella sp.]
MTPDTLCHCDCEARSRKQSGHVIFLLPVTCFVICLLSARWIASCLAMTPDAIACNNGISVIAKA